MQIRRYLPDPAHWPEYLIEAAALGTFMVSACLFGTVIFGPDTFLPWMGEDAVRRRALMGVFMALTAVSITYSPFGRRSGAHINPALTLAFLWLRRISPRDATGYVLAQFAGAVGGVTVARAIIGPALADPAVNFVVTQPGRAGVGGVLAALTAEVVISAILMTAVLRMLETRWSRWTGVMGGLLVALFITVESPISGMSMNPARSFGSAAAANAWMPLWLYFIAPLTGMFLAAYLFTRGRRQESQGCAKYMHAEPCIFCEYRRNEALQGRSESLVAGGARVPS